MQNALKAALVDFVLTIPATLAAQDLDAGMEAYHRGDFALALIEFKPLAEQGDAKAQSSLGYMYAAGQGVAQDLRRRRCGSAKLPSKAAAARRPILAPCTVRARVWRRTMPRR